MGRGFAYYIWWVSRALFVVILLSDYRGVTWRLCKNHLIIAQSQGAQESEPWAAHSTTPLSALNNSFNASCTKILCPRAYRGEPPSLLLPLLRYVSPIPFAMNSWLGFQS